MILTRLVPLILLLLSVSGFSQSEINHIQTTGNAVVYAPPDEVYVHFNFIVRSERFREARSECDARTREAIKTCKDLGIAKQHIQTDYLRLSTHRKRNSWKEEDINYYQASQNISVCLKELEKFDRLIDALIDINVSNISGIEFRTTQLRRYKDEARDKAIMAAKEKAERMAGVLGVSIGSPLSIEEIKRSFGGSGQLAYSNTVTESHGSDVEGLGFAPGQMKIEAEVEIKFELISD